MLTAESLNLVQLLVSTEARSAGLPENSIVDLTIAVHELAAAVAGHGVLCTWREGRSVICEIRAFGDLGQPFDLTTVKHLCDIVQVRTLPAATVVRIRKRGG